MKYLIELLTKLVALLTKKKQMDNSLVPDQGNPPMTPIAPAPTPHSKILQWAMAIERQEGAKPELKNPGNLKYTALTASWGGSPGFQATDGGSICRFDTYEDGLRALCNFLTLGCQNELLAFHKARTLRLFTNVYANPPNNNYVNGVAKYLGVSPDVDISTLL